MATDHIREISECLEDKHLPQGKSRKRLLKSRAQPSLKCPTFTKGRKQLHLQEQMGVI